MTDNRTITVDGSYTHELSIPSSWHFAQLNEVIDIVGGNQPPKTFFSDQPGPDKIRLIQIRDYKSDQNIVYIPKDKAKRFVSTTDVMIGRYGPPIFQILRGLEGAYNVALMKAVPKMGVFDNEYLFHYLKNRDIYNYVNAASDRTAGQSGVNKAHLEKYPVGLPPLAEQKVIAKKLDKLLAKVDSIKTRLDAVPDTLKRFRQSVLAAAVSGKLTEEWREKFKPAIVDIASISEEQFSSGLTMGNFGKKKDRSPDIADEESRKFVSHIAGWPSIRLGALCECVVPNRDKPKSFSGGYHWLLTPNFDEQSIWIDYKEIENGLSEDEVITYRAKIIEPGNVIMTCVGRVGLSAVLEESSVINQQLHAFKVNKHIKAEYLAYCVRANVEYYEDKATSTTVKYLNKTACNSLPIPLPTIEEQTEIVRRVEKLFAYADKVEAEVNAAQERVNKLTQSILAKAFRGELTAKWREQNPELISGENSAEALLEKIKTEREKLKPIKKRKAK
ncbi:restriction endonuclease subunit S [Alteromonas sp. McT4-15]|uniref:restriction endonuclease subunit S n=1 Tax=Alteromonas sp. McT4-15 TaxID=2881256 RepID=UPI001CF84AC3|nr:restriction endonuclease subunit S [Alteromonas sp. McT4-15]MCB4436985.1 restriction endonuclease subunit S [Alteromonas sp. McT4-15]